MIVCVFCFTEMQGQLIMYLMLTKVQRAIIDRNGPRITNPYSLDTHWGFADSIRGYGAVYE